MILFSLIYNIPPEHMVIYEGSPSLVYGSICPCDTQVYGSSPVIWEQYIRMGVQVVLGGQVHNSSTHGQPNNSSVQGSARLCVDCEVRVMQCFQMRCVAAWRSPPPAYLPRPLSLTVPPAVSQHLTHPRATLACLPLPWDASVTAPACYSLPLSSPYLAP